MWPGCEVENNTVGTWWQEWLATLVMLVGGKPNPPRSVHWPALRLRHLKKEPLCQYCLTDKDLQVHHIIPVMVDRSRELDEENLITLCELRGPKGCHLRIGHHGHWRTYNPDVRADCRNNRRL